MRGRNEEGGGGVNILDVNHVLTHLGTKRTSIHVRVTLGGDMRVTLGGEQAFM